MTTSTDYIYGRVGVGLVPHFMRRLVQHNWKFKYGAGCNEEMECIDLAPGLIGVLYFKHSKNIF
jgi:hypothetical protein